ncbi:hypothetical protein Hanom_Chr16g01512641 [Helianthus anomalus]
MSFSGRWWRSRIYSIVVLMIIISLFQIWVLSNDCCRVKATRISSSLSSSSKDSDDDKRSELYKKFFNGRFTRKINTTTVSNGKGFQETKRKVPSCPDALHN